MGAVPHLLFVEDDPQVAASVSTGLAEAGYDVTHMRTAEESTAFLAETQVDLAVLDLGLPGKDGLHVLRYLRDEVRHTPVIILTARDTVPDRVEGLDAGADDYMVKPFAFSELLARVRARLRHADLVEPVLLKVGDLEIDVVNRHVVRAGSEIDLTTLEFDVLRHLASHAGKTVSREMLARTVWRIQSRATPLDNVIDVHISRLRDKVDRDFDPKLIHTVRGVGFVMRQE